jgi:hypothetical protein
MKKNEEMKEVKEQVGVTSIFQGLSLHDFSTENSRDKETFNQKEDSDPELTERFQKWRNIWIIGMSTGRHNKYLGPRRGNQTPST